MLPNIRRNTSQTLKPLVTSSCVLTKMELLLLSILSGHSQACAQHLREAYDASASLGPLHHGHTMLLPKHHQACAPRPHPYSGLSFTGPVCQSDTHALT
jgi:hypothetical protein